MLGYLEGTIIHKDLNYVLLLINGVGYKVFAPLGLLSELIIGQNAKLYIHQHVKEDDISLFGFKDLSDQKLFELLLSVSGIGPKSALQTLSVASAEEIRQAVVNNDASLLTKVSGIGQKIAERIILELKNKLSATAASGAWSTAGDEIDALVQLGYTISQARQALQKVEPAVTDSAERLKQALKYLS